MHINKHRHKDQQQRPVHAHQHATRQDDKPRGNEQDARQLILQLQREQKDNVQTETAPHQTRLPLRAGCAAVVLQLFIRKREPAYRQQRQHHHQRQRGHLPGKGGERQPGPSPQKDILRVANWRQKRACIDG